MALLQPQGLLTVIVGGLLVLAGTYIQSVDKTEIERNKPFVARMELNKARLQQNQAWCAGVLNYLGDDTPNRNLSEVQKRSFDAMIERAAKDCHVVELDGLEQNTPVAPLMLTDGNRQ